MSDIISKIRDTFSNRFVATALSATLAGSLVVPPSTADKTSGFFTENVAVAEQRSGLEAFLQMVSIQSTYAEQDSGLILRSRDHESSRLNNRERERCRTFYETYTSYFEDMSDVALVAYILMRGQNNQSSDILVPNLSQGAIRFGDREVGFLVHEDLDIEANIRNVIGQPLLFPNTDAATRQRMYDAAVEAMSALHTRLNAPRRSNGRQYFMLEPEVLLRIVEAYAGANLPEVNTARPQPLDDALRNDRMFAEWRHLQRESMQIESHSESRLNSPGLSQQECDRWREFYLAYENLIPDFTSVAGAVHALISGRISRSLNRHVENRAEHDFHVGSLPALSLNVNGGQTGYASLRRLLRSDFFSGLHDEQRNSMFEAALDVLTQLNLADDYLRTARSDREINLPREVLLAMIEARFGIYHPQGSEPVALPRSPRSRPATPSPPTVAQPTSSNFAYVATQVEEGNNRQQQRQATNDHERENGFMFGVAPMYFFVEGGLGNLNEDVLLHGGGARIYAGANLDFISLVGSVTVGGLDSTNSWTTYTHRERHRRSNGIYYLDEDGTTRSLRNYVFGTVGIDVLFHIRSFLFGIGVNIGGATPSIAEQDFSRTIEEETGLIYNPTLSRTEDVNQTYAYGGGEVLLGASFTDNFSASLHAGFLVSSSDSGFPMLFHFGLDFFGSL